MCNISEDSENYVSIEEHQKLKVKVKALESAIQHNTVDIHLLSEAIVGLMKAIVEEDKKPTVNFKDIDTQNIDMSFLL